MTGRIDVTVDGPIATVVIANEQKRNALSASMWAQLREAIEAAASQPSVRSLVLRGEGSEAFCAGGDFDELQQLAADAAARERFLRAVEGGFAAITCCRVPVIAMLHGFAVGGGMALACMCDLRIADTQLRVGIPATRIGVIPSRTEVDAIASLVGASRATELFLTGRLVGSEEAAAWGLVNRVVPPDDLEATTVTLAEQIAAAAPTAARAVRRLLAQARFSHDDADVAASAASLGGEEFAESIAARRADRQPRFADSR